MQRRAFLATLAAAGTAGCGAVFGSESAGHDVGMTASAFDPGRITADAGATVVWKNTSGRAHTVTAYEERIPEDAAYFASGGFASESAARDGYADGLEGAIYSGETYEHVFETPGRYHYFCVPHERAGMVGTIDVG